MNRCKTCKHWRRDGERMSVNEFNDGLGICDHPKVTGEAQDALVRVSAMDASYEVLTNPEFGCVLHEAK